MTRPTDVSVKGPLAPHVLGFCTELAAQGYTPLSAANQVRLMAHVSRWLEAHDLGPGGLTPQSVEKFLEARRREGYTSFLSERALEPLLGYLHGIGVVPPPDPPAAITAFDRLLERYVDYLRQERGLVSSTVQARRKIAHRFLMGVEFREDGDLHRLTAAEVTGFMLRKGQGSSIGHAKLIGTGLRSFLRFVYVQGLTQTQLDAAVPAIAGSRGSALPRDLEPSFVEALLRSCDRRRGTGRRDYAILLLLSRLGLRIGEVASMELDDVDWRQGELMIRGKGQRHERLPLPADVGEALAGYVRRGRPRVDCRRLFLRCHAPLRGLTTSAVNEVVRRACLRAGLPVVRSHRLRHTAATQMLRRGASLAEIAQVLRHRNLSTTTIYAKVDREALRALAQPWPGDLS